MNIDKFPLANPKDGTNAIIDNFDRANKLATFHWKSKLFLKWQLGFK